MAHVHTPVQVLKVIVGGTKSAMFPAFYSCIRGSATGVETGNEDSHPGRTH